MKDSLGRSAVGLTITKLMTTMIKLVITMLLSGFRTLTEYGVFLKYLLLQA